MSELENALRGAGADATSLTYVRTLKRNNLTGARSECREGGQYAPLS